MSNQEEVELRAKIEALGLEVTKLPEQAPKQLSEVMQVLLSCFIAGPVWILRSALWHLAE